MLFCCYCVVLLFVLFVIIVLFYVSIVCTATLPPGVNPIAVDKYININIEMHGQQNIKYAET